MPDIFTQIFEYKLGGIPIVPIIVALGIIYLFYIFVFKGKNIKIPFYKKRELKKEIKEYNYADLNIGFPINKTLCYFTPIRYAISGTFHNGIAKLKKEKDKMVLDESETKCLIMNIKTRPLGFIARLLSWLNIGIVYYSVPNEALTELDKILKIDRNLDYVIDNGMYIFGDAAKSVSIEQVSYLKNRENELEAHINWYPKQAYNEQMMAIKAAEAREKATIEKEKYRGQTDE